MPKPSQRHMPRDTTAPSTDLSQTPRVKVWLEIDGDYVFGYGIAQILSAVEQTGSIKQAAVQLGKSYRYVWGRIKKAEQTLQRPLVETRVGGQGDRRSSLSEFAHETLSNFMELRQRMHESLDQEFVACFRKSHEDAS